MPKPKAPPASESLPKSIGKYEPIAVFARRAFSKTYRAREPELLRTVLLKTLHPSVSAESPFGQLLEREAKVLGPLEHEGVLKLLAIGRPSGGIALIFEDPKGHTLADVLAAMRAQNRRIEPAVCIAIAHGIARTLAYLHGQGVVHCDLMPEHVLIAPDGSIKLFEFSAAKEPHHLPIPELLEGEGIFSRPDYWSPERRLGETITPRADVFSLGVMLYEMLSFELPFRDPAQASGPRSEEERPHKMRGTAIALRTFMPGLSRSVNDAVMRCLAKRPEERFEHGKALSDALADIAAEWAESQARSERMLCARALYLARFIETEPVFEESGLSPAEAPKPEGAAHRQWFQASVSRFILIFILIVFGGILIELGIRKREGEDTGGSALVGVEDPGYIRVLARPWAEIYVDGEYVDVTPIGKPIAVAPGRRHLTFKHPNAPEEKRTITVLKAQTVVVDVSMRVDKFKPDAGPIRTNIDTTP